ncbi:hypothetical protein Terro_2809 [Terriglobus roseus DSM 18391]|uniref:Sporulation related domain-containing protein n=1 Tax=Terriglobus roseus (strain DSM 18391 / NRRL B-41598 / KBS 63) TaxID=926566 RepID=I3ZIH7_TERRK|nr:hypothetical protein [Terriglobus roseus]AFL89045.1 hypothetical protein Terro_2809 [Terriglobus roseus DSM 18391]
MRQAIVCAATILFSLSAVAQTKVCMGGNLDSMSSTERHSCEKQVQMTREAAVDAKVSGDWHFVVVCGEDGWKDYMAFSQQGEAPLRTATSDTDVAAKTIYLRGTRLESADAAVQIIANSLRKPAGDDIVLARN